ncbi:MAG TPA: hypothetical protein VJ507_02165 [Candidatus Bathyarchaeia archaeon]|nr:hypothetical protein [Candidatus Bathyarchaeia archaeon]
MGRLKPEEKVAVTIDMTDAVFVSARTESERKIQKSVKKSLQKS